MNTLKMIVYPFSAAILGMILTTLVGLAVFGVTEWQEWQNRLMSMFGIIVGFSGAVTGLYLAVRSGEHLPR